MSVEPTPGRAYQQYTIIKQDDPNFAPIAGGEHNEGVRQGYAADPADVPTYAMPSGPGFTGGRRKTRTFPRGILRKTHKIVPTRDPTRAPATRKRSIRLASDKRIREARKSAKLRAAKTDIAAIRKTLTDKKIISSDKKKVPHAVLRTLYADAVGAGLLN